MSLALTKTLISKSMKHLVGSGILSGLRVLAQETPDMSVRVISGASRSAAGQPIVYPEDGIAGVVYTDKLHPMDIKAVNVLPIASSAPDKPRTDLIYVSKDGVILVGNGTNINHANLSPSETDIKPIVPDGGFPLAYVSVPAGATSIRDVDIVDARLFNRLTKGLQPKNVIFYEEGIEYVGWTFGEASNANCFFNKEKDHLRLNVRQNNAIHYITAVTRDPIDFTPFKKLHFEFGRDGYRGDTGSRVYFIVGTKTGGISSGIQASVLPPDLNRYLAAWNRGGVVTIDVSNVNGEHHIRLGANDNTTSGTSRWAELKVWRVWGEK